MNIHYLRCFTDLLVGTFQFVSCCCVAYPRISQDIFEFLPSLPLIYYEHAHFYAAVLFPDALAGATISMQRLVRVPTALVPSLAAQILGAGRKFTETEILAAFAAAEDIPFPLADLEKLVPAICKHCSAVADSLSVPLSWVLLAEVCTAAFLAPTSVLLPTKTLPLYSMPWALILHPGATQTSGLMAAYNRTLRQIELWEDEFQLAQAKLAFRQQQDGAQPAAAGSDEQVTKRPRFTPPPPMHMGSPPPMHMGFTSGSIDGVVGRMAEPQNLSRAAAFLAEGLIFLSWISDQCASHKGLITQLTDRILWDKVTVKACFSNVCFLF